MIYQPAILLTKNTSVLIKYATPVRKVEMVTIHFSSHLSVSSPLLRVLSLIIIFINLLPIYDCFTQNRIFRHDFNPSSRPVRWGPLEKRADGLPLVITNNCPEIIWPAILTQAGTGPGTGGFELTPGSTISLAVSRDWQGRVWGRTNCSFNDAGTRASNLNGNNGAGAACDTGDCGGVLNCVNSGETPVTLVEFDLAGGASGRQAFYDISLVDGYNLPVGINFIPGNNDTLRNIPSRLTDCACIGTAGFLAPLNAENIASIPYESEQTNATVAEWCPWNLQQTQPTKPIDGIYIYPDSNIQRPAFAPCFSACSKTNSPRDCCTGKYNSPSACKAPLYAIMAKAVCPDAYSYAYDDQTSTFIVPSGGGWGVRFCPAGRSTNILATSKQELQKLS